MGCFLFRRNTSCWFRHLAGGTDQMGTSPQACFVGSRPLQPPVICQIHPCLCLGTWDSFQEMGLDGPGSPKPTDDWYPKAHSPVTLGQPRKRPFSVFSHPLRPSLMGLSTRGADSSWASSSFCKSPRARCTLFSGSHRPNAITWVPCGPEGRGGYGWSLNVSFLLFPNPHPNQS